MAVGLKSSLFLNDEENLSCVGFMYYIIFSDVEVLTFI